ncbi:hypothetical protein [Paenibacillus contaminans]|uniref:hypothetical protein n=1 Tax=Paenibacillus contaminans TaxID=450362 RepID=UPI00131438B9|nr:hypothetical protein [Paenibacillus contaminans]
MVRLPQRFGGKKCDLVRRERPVEYRKPAERAGEKIAGLARTVDRPDRKTGAVRSPNRR